MILQDTAIMPPPSWTQLRESSEYEENRPQLDKEHHLRESSPFLSTDRRLPYGNCDSMTQGIIWQGLPRGTARAWHGASI